MTIADATVEKPSKKSKYTPWDDFKEGCTVQDKWYADIRGIITKKLKTVVYILVGGKITMKYDRAHATQFLIVVQG